MNAPKYLTAAASRSSTGRIVDVAMVVLDCAGASITRYQSLIVGEYDGPEVDITQELQAGRGSSFESVTETVLQICTSLAWGTRIPPLIVAFEEDPIWSLSTDASELAPYLDQSAEGDKAYHRLYPRGPKIKCATGRAMSRALFLASLLRRTMPCASCGALPRAHPCGPCKTHRAPVRKRR